MWHFEEQKHNETIYYLLKMPRLIWIYYGHQNISTKTKTYIDKPKSNS